MKKRNLNLNLKGGYSVGKVGKKEIFKIPKANIGLKNIFHKVKLPKQKIGNDLFKAPKIKAKELKPLRVLFPKEDSDKDGRPNKIDCNPLNKKEQHWKMDTPGFVKKMKPSEFLEKTTNLNYKTDSFFNYYSDIETGKSEPITKLGVYIVSPRHEVEIPFLGKKSVHGLHEHEGRHRAVASDFMEEEEIPVRVSIPKEKREELAEKFIQERFSGRDERYKNVWRERFKEGMPENQMDKESLEVYRKVLKNTGNEIGSDVLNPNADTDGDGVINKITDKEKILDEDESLLLATKFGIYKPEGEDFQLHGDVPLFSTLKSLDTHGLEIRTEKDLWKRPASFELHSKEASEMFENPETDVQYHHAHKNMGSYLFEKEPQFRLKKLGKYLEEKGIEDSDIYSSEEKMGKLKTLSGDYSKVDSKELSREDVKELVKDDLEKIKNSKSIDTQYYRMKNKLGRYRADFDEVEGDEDLLENINTTEKELDKKFYDSYNKNEESKTDGTITDKDDDKIDEDEKIKDIKILGFSKKDKEKIKTIINRNPEIKRNLNFSGVTIKKLPKKEEFKKFKDVGKLKRLGVTETYDSNKDWVGDRTNVKINKTLLNNKEKLKETLLHESRHVKDHRTRTPKQAKLMYLDYLKDQKENEYYLNYINDEEERMSNGLMLLDKDNSIKKITIGKPIINVTKEGTSGSMELEYEDDKHVKHFKHITRHSDGLLVVEEGHQVPGQEPVFDRVRKIDEDESIPLRKSKKITLYHGTLSKNIPKILKEGLGENDEYEYVSTSLGTPYALDYPSAHSVEIEEDIKKHPEKQGLIKVTVPKEKFEKAYVHGVDAPITKRELYKKIKEGHEIEIAFLGKTSEGEKILPKEYLSEIKAKDIKKQKVEIAKRELMLEKLGKENRKISDEYIYSNIPIKDLPENKEKLVEEIADYTKKKWEEKHGEEFEDFEGLKKYIKGKNKEELRDTLENIRNTNVEEEIHSKYAEREIDKIIDKNKKDKEEIVKEQK